MPTNLLNGPVVQTVKTIRDPGVIFDDKLTFSNHICHITLRAYRVLGLLYRDGREFRNAHTLLYLFSAFVKNILKYLIDSPEILIQFGFIDPRTYLRKNKLLAVDKSNQNYITFEPKKWNGGFE